MARPAGRKGAAAPHAVRIIGGRWKRTRLPVADRAGLRPTPDRVRETLFNWLGQDLTGWRCLDAFAGSGALGLEAASRGASEVVMLERDAQLAQSLRSTAQRLGATGVRVECADAIGWMARCAPARFDLIFLDPPFDAGLGPPALEAAVRVMAPGGAIYLEAGEPLDASAAEALGLRVVRQSRAGAVHFHTLRLQDEG